MSQYGIYKVGQVRKDCTTNWGLEIGGVAREKISLGEGKRGHERCSNSVKRAWSP